MHVDFGQNTRDYITDYVKFADTKAGAVLALAITLASLTGSWVDRALTSLRDAPVTLKALATAPGLAVVVATFMIVWHTIHAVRPRTADADRSLASFPDIAKLSAAEYSTNCATLTSEALAQEYAKLNVELARTAVAKFAAINDAIWWLRVQLFGAYLLFLVFGYLRYRASD